MSYKYFFYSSSVKPLLIYCMCYPSRLGETFFFLEETIHHQISSQLDSHILKTAPYDNKIKFVLYMLFVRLKIFCLVKFMSGRGETTFFGTDNQLFSPFFYRKGKFILIEEGEGNHIEGFNINFEPSGLFRKIKDFIIYGGLRKAYGRSPYIDEIILTKKSSASLSYTKGKRVSYINLKELFKSETVSKTVGEIFSFGKLKSELEQCDGMLTVIFSQPLHLDGIMSIKEENFFYQKAVRLSPHDNIIVKPHPRQKKLPETLKKYKSIEGVAPAELLLLLESRISCVITYNSAAVDIFRHNSNVKIITADEVN
ncbi:polysialyltransferase family glycosyltransferase [Zobellella maritima]|uniref:polysialyltransferase family glycosyltransferase n=1 Tax=Zobellella maritima TaxID=2059725 RepID=UPI001300B978|nr:polysialyltransferase family glycosyltransferase [Zobellella maritima]